MDINDRNTCHKCKLKFALSRATCPNCGEPAAPPTGAPYIETIPNTNKKLTPCKACGNLVSKQTNKCPACGQSRITPVKIALTIIVIGIIVMYKISFYLSDKQAEKENIISQKQLVEQKKQDDIQAEINRKAYEKTLIKQQEAREFKQLFQQAHNKLIENTKLKTSWWPAGFGNILEATFTITNNNERALTDINITCTTYAQSGTQLSKVRHTLYNNFPAKHITTIKDANLGFINSQTHKVGCHIADVDY